MRKRVKKFGFSLVELLIVLGIFSLIIGASFTLLSSGRLSVSISEAQIQAKEHARMVMERINREVHSSSSKINKQTGKRICIITDGLTSDDNVDNGSLIYFQVPVEESGGTLDLNTDNTLKWGSHDAEGKYICYFLGEDTDRLFRSTCNADKVGKPSVSDAAVQIAPNISSINFSRASEGSDLINIEIVGRGQTSAGEEITQTLHSSVKLRN